MTPGAGHLDVTDAASLPAAEVLARLSSSPRGLDAAEAARRLCDHGPNAVRSHAARPLGVLLRQLRSPLLLLLAVTAAASFLLGERTDGGIIAVILTLSVGLGFVNEYRAERAAEALHDRIRHRALVLRPAGPAEVDVTALVPGDVVRLTLGSVVPADLRLLAADGLECVEAVLTGEAAPSPKSPDPVPPRTTVAELSSCALMGTIVQAGSGEGVVVATGGQAEFGRVALALGDRQPDTEFQVGLRRFSGMLARVALALSTAIFAVNVLLDRPLLEALLFSLAIAVGITPQLLPAVVTTSLATGSHRLAARRVLVKRLVCIEDLGDVQVLFTDKTGTLTEGRIGFLRALAPDGTPDDRALLLGLVCSDTVVVNGRRHAGNPLDAALWEAPAAARQAADGFRRVADLPFDHVRRRMTVLVDGPDRRRVLVTKGAPEGVLGLCRDVPAAARAVLDAEFATGGRVVAVATRAADGASGLRPGDERDLTLAGFLVFLDAPKPSAGVALRRLAALGVTTKVLTGDAAPVAVRVCEQLSLEVQGVLAGSEVERMTDEALGRAVVDTTVFARVSPEDKARIVRAHRERGHGVAFLGDGVNDAVALHAADVGVSVDTATDVAKDAADVVLLEKDLGVLGDGVVEGRRIFANTMKYVLMGTSSNFGNMASAAAASLFLPFLPMLPSQILLNNLLYDTSQL
ncbi:MAG TPA: HAD-IC family P-type ATPase, partial [Mycobacteriales bacterium]|nr:HAD-IC family P-type ATPase [Mycobacteriales bacterium]